MRFFAVAAIGLMLAACGGSTPAAVRPVKASGEGVPPAREAGGASAPSNSGPSLDALAARGPTDAPLMREVLRLEQVERAAPRTAVVRAERDVCVRAVFAASREVKVWFADDTETPRGETTTAATGLVPPRGPACAKKGEVLRFVVDKGEGESSTRVVIFAAP